MIMSPNGIKYLSLVIYKSVFVSKVVSLRRLTKVSHNSLCLIELNELRPCFLIYLCNKSSSSVRCMI
jgi:hypothetical protein